MPTRRLTIINRLGLHARAAAKFVERAQAFDATIELGRVAQTNNNASTLRDEPPDTDAARVDGKSMMSVMLLAASQGTELELHAEGHDADAALASIEALIAERFGEDD